MPSIHLTEAENNQSFDIHAGDEIVIELDESPTTGYRWAVDQLDTDVFASPADKFSLAGPGVGTGGKRRLTFKAQKPGSTSVALKLWRDWQGDASIIDRFHIAIDVH